MGLTVYKMNAMMNKVLLASLMGMLALSSLKAQESELYMPRRLQKAYQNNTRSFNGAAGANYYQNTASYDIRARFEPESGILEGEETITYHNNSPDTLERLVLRVYMNFFRKGVSRDFSIPASDLHDGVSIKNLTVNNRELNSPGGPQLSSEFGTIYTIKLLNPIMPDGDAKISLNWKVQLPTEVAIRMGRYGEGNNWMVAYWYPQVSVYDDIYGWDTHPFAGSAEFYNDFNDYDVRLTLPADYMVWGTGILQNPEQHYNNEILKRIEKAKRVEEVVSIVTRDDIEKNNVLKDKEEHTWHFVAEDVPDFAFATSREYLWDGTSVEIDPRSERRTFVSAVYEPEASFFDQVAEIGRKVIKLFSGEVMGTPFAYPRLTVFNGSGGMEFPMIINDGDISSFEGTVHLTAHEIGHNYFPFYVMTNESYYAFMDEGLITFLPRLAEKKIVEDHEPFSDLIAQYESHAGTMREIPLMIKSYMISDYYAYRIHAYQRPATAFYLLREYLGGEAFHKALKEYIERWAKKHPTPYDFFFTFEDVLNQDLSWFWEPWFFELGYPDLAVSNVTQEDGLTTVIVRKKGQLPVPVHLEVAFTNGEKEVYNRPMDVWKNGKEEIQFELKEKESIDIIRLGNERIPDIRDENNMYRLK
jgi:hypothetical protein